MSPASAVPGSVLVRLCRAGDVGARQAPGGMTRPEGAPLLRQGSGLSVHGS